jgi:hypothetical protein
MVNGTPVHIPALTAELKFLWTIDNEYWQPVVKTISQMLDVTPGEQLNAAQARAGLRVPSALVSV